MVFERLVVEAAEHIRAYRRVGQDTTDGGNTVQIPLARVFAVHQFQYLVRPALHRQVDKTAQVLVSSNGLQGLV